MKIDKHQDVTIEGADYVQIYVDGETLEIFGEELLGDADVEVEIHEYKDQ